MQISDLEYRASAFATTAHGSVDQRRKWTDRPYIEHPAAVAEIVRSVPHDDAMLAAAWLHDTVEDTPVTINEILAAFGPDVADLVAWLTNPATHADGERAARKALNRAHSAASPARAQTIKLADVIDNCSTVAELAPDFARVYLPEKAALVEALTLADPTLIALARGRVAAYI